jgi:hypothetical protein
MVPGFSGGRLERLGFHVANIGRESRLVKAVGIEILGMWAEASRIG